MLGVMDIYALRRKVLVEGQSQRRVAREMGVARDTVRRYLETPAPERQERQRSSPVLDRVRPRLEQLLEEWSHRTTAKQRITGRRLHRQLREEGYEVGLTLVLAELREWRRRRAEVYAPLVHRPAESAQVDFFEVRVDLAGERRRVWLLVFRLMHSGRDYVRLYERQDQLAFLDGHVRAFAHFGGVPRRMVYDNLSAAVRRVQFPRRRLTERFAALASHYAFEPSFARPGQGHDKGGVEGRGRGLRWQVLTPLPRGDSLQQISDEMQAEVDRLAPERVWERFAAEGPLLRPLPAVAFEPRRMQPVSVNRSAMVRLEGAWYSVPERWAGLRVTAWVGVSEVAFQRGAEQVSHPRQRFGGRRVRYRHYLGELSRKPQALRQVAPELVDELGGPYDRLWDLLEDERGGHEAARALARLLQADAEHGEERVRAALEAGLAEGGFDELAVRRSLAASQAPDEVTVPERLRGCRVEQASLADFDRLLERGAS
ncbi:MAG: IS21 family transposase [Chloroflexota bacterium]|nr:IS21 family transposase [Chloroflexota bacterium]